MSEKVEALVPERHPRDHATVPCCSRAKPAKWVCDRLFKLTEFREGKNVLCWKTSASSHQGFLTQALTACPSLATGSLFRGLSDCV